MDIEGNIPEDGLDQVSTESVETVLEALKVEETTTQSNPADNETKIKRENQNLRKRIRELEEGKGKEVDGKKLMEERLAALEAKQKQMEAENQRLLLVNSITREANVLGLDAELALKLVGDQEITRDERGNPTNVTTVLNDYVAKWPHLKRQAIPQLPTSAPQTMTSGGTFTDEALSRMSVQEIMDNWELVTKSLK